ncbi:MAG: metallophosphoesterase family protein [Myxococcota bacterium]
MAVIRILHFSDVHLEGPTRGAPLREWINKRGVAYVAHRLIRRHRFEDAERKLEALARLAAHERVDMALCTGDHTALGTHPELARARRVLEPFAAAPLGLMALPGNHDVFLPASVRDRRFERYFGDLCATDRPDLTVDGRWPLVRLPAPGLAVVAVNTVRPNPPLWRSSGRIPDAQLQVLRRVLADPELRRRFVVVALHHAPRLASGRPDRFWHGLVNADALRRALAGLGAGMLVHGHVHQRYHLDAACFGVPLFGAGSVTHGGREGFWLYEVGPEGEVRAHGGRWTGQRYELQGPPVQVSWRGR